MKLLRAKIMELNEFNIKSEISSNTKLESEQLEILELNDTKYFDKESGWLGNLLYDLAGNKSISEKVQSLLAVKVLDSSYSTQELKKHLLGNENLSDATFEILLNQNNIFIFYFALDFLKLSKERKTKILDKLEYLGLVEILTEGDLYKNIHSFKFPEVIQLQILEEDYHLFDFVNNPYLTEYIQLKIIQSKLFEHHVHAISEEDYKVYLYQKFVEKCPNITEKALLALCEKKDNLVLYTIAKRENLPKSVILGLIENSNLVKKNISNSTLFIDNLTTLDLMKEVIDRNVLDEELQIRALNYNNDDINICLSKKEWINLDTVQYLSSLDNVEILDNLCNAKLIYMSDKLLTELKQKTIKHIDYEDYVYCRDHLL